MRSRISSAAVLAALLALAGAACTSPGPAAAKQQGALDPGMVAEGRRIAERECASCHAIDHRSASPNREAPPLRQVLSGNDAENLTNHFIEAVRVGHDDMPLFDFNVIAADSLVAYLKSIASR